MTDQELKDNCQEAVTTGLALTIPTAQIGIETIIAIVGIATTIWQECVNKQKVAKTLDKAVKNPYSLTAIRTRRLLTKKMKANNIDKEYQDPKVLNQLIVQFNNKLKQGDKTVL